MRVKLFSVADSLVEAERDRREPFALNPGPSFELTDGLKAVWPDRRLSARASNTEPIIRLTAEAPTESDARSLMHSALECLSPSA